MDIEQTRILILSFPESTESQPFGDDCLVFKVRNKMFAMLSFDVNHTDWISLKCNPDYANVLREQYPDVIKPAWHMNHKHWNQVNFTSLELNNDFIAHLIAHSYNEVIKKMSRSKRSGLNELKEGLFNIS